MHSSDELAECREYLTAKVVAAKKLKCSEECR